jgi:hypothetical protein
MRSYCETATPFFVETIGKPVDDIEALCIPINQGKVRSAQFLRAHERCKRVLSK